MSWDPGPSQAAEETGVSAESRKSRSSGEGGLISLQTVDLLNQSWLVTQGQIGPIASQKRHMAGALVFRNARLFASERGTFFFRNTLLFFRSCLLLFDRLHTTPYCRQRWLSASDRGLWRRLPSREQQRRLRVVRLAADAEGHRQGLRINVDLVLRRSVLTLKLWKC